MIDAPGQPFHDPEADRRLFDALRTNLTSSVRLVEVDAHINDPQFAEAVAAEMLGVLAETRAG
jgi:uncharacterized protein (UPF0261 family)